MGRWQRREEGRGKRKAEGNEDEEEEKEEEEEETAACSGPASARGSRTAAHGGPTAA